MLRSEIALLAKSERSAFVFGPSVAFGSENDILFCGGKRFAASRKGAVARRRAGKTIFRPFNLSGEAVLSVDRNRFFRRNMCAGLLRG